MSGDDGDVDVYLRRRALQLGHRSIMSGPFLRRERVFRRENILHVPFQRVSDMVTDRMKPEFLPEVQLKSTCTDYLSMVVVTEPLQQG